MTYTITPRGTISTLNSITLSSSGGSQNTTPYNINSGTVVSATTTTVVLDASASAIDSTYNNLVFDITSGTGVNYLYKINSYVGSTKTATINGDFTVIPDSTSTYVIHQNSGQCPEQNLTASTNTIKLASHASSVNNFYTNSYIIIQTGFSIREHHFIIGYNGTTKVATLTTDITTIVSSETMYFITGEGGTATSGTSNTIELDGNQSSLVNTQYLYIDIKSGTGASQGRQIVSLSTNTLTVTPNWDITPDSTSVYVIYSGWVGTFENIVNYPTLTTVSIINTIIGERALAVQEYGVTTTDSVLEKHVELSSLSPDGVHSSTVVTQTFRFKIVALGTTTNGFTQVIYNTFKNAKLTAQIEETIQGNYDCDITRSILTGTTRRGKYINANVDTTGNLQMRIQRPIGAYGDVMTSENIPVAQYKFTYGLNSQEVTQFIAPATLVTMGTEGGVGTPQVQSIYLPKASIMNSSGTASYFTLQDGGANNFYVWYSIGTAADPAIGGSTGLQVTITSGQTSSQVGSATQTVVDGNAAFSASVFGNIVTITNATSTAANPKSINVLNMPTVGAGTITTTKSEAEVSITNGDGVGDFSLLRSRRGIKFRPGQGAVMIFAVIYDTPVANTIQYCGAGNAVSAIYLGYNGTTFGISRRTAGLPEIQTLTISSVASATTGTVIVTVDGIDYTVTLSSVTTTQVVAQQIGAINFEGALYVTEVVNNTVIFSSNRLTIGTHSFTFALGTATNITGSFVETTSAQDVTNTITNQADWNIDRLDGGGPSGMVLNPQKGNVYKIEYKWGYGDISFLISDPLSGEFIPFHQIKYANRNTQVSLSQPDMKNQSFVASTFATTPITLKIHYGSLFVQGKIERFAPRFGYINSHNTISTATTNNIILELKNGRIYNGRYNNSEIKLVNMTVSSTKSANNTKATTTFSIVRGGTHSAINKQYVSQPDSCSYVATPVRGTALTGFTILYTTAVPAEGAQTIDLTLVNIVFPANEEIYIIYSNTAPSTGDVDISVNLTWVEDQ